MRRTRTVLVILALGWALPATAEEYDPLKAGHPVRIAAYALHPVGVLLDYLLMRPAWWLGGKEPIRTLVGREPDTGLVESAMQGMGTRPSQVEPEPEPEPEPSAPTP